MTLYKSSLVTLFLRQAIHSEEAFRSISTSQASSRERSTAKCAELADPEVCPIGIGLWSLFSGKVINLLRRILQPFLVLLLSEEYIRIFGGIW